MTKNEHELILEISRDVMKSLLRNPIWYQDVLKTLNENTMSATDVMTRTAKISVGQAMALIKEVGSLEFKEKEE